MNLEETDDKNELDNELWFSFGNKISNNTIIVKAIIETTKISRLVSGCLILTTSGVAFFDFFYPPWLFVHIILVRYWGSRDGAVVRLLTSHQCGLGSIPGPGIICGLSLLLVLYSAPGGFSPGTPVFPSTQKTTFLNSNSISECRDIFWTSSWELLGAPWVNKLHF